MENNVLDPNYVPDEYRVPFDVIELPSQGLLYPGKKSTVKVEYLTTYDENIFSSPNLKNSGKILDVLLERKIKDLGFDPIDLLDGDRMAILIFLRSTGLGNLYKQPIINPKTNKVEIGEIDLTTLKNKTLDVSPDNNGEFDYVTDSGKKIKFRLLTGRDYNDIDVRNQSILDRYQGDDKISEEKTLTLERMITEIDGERDKMKLSRIIKILPPIETRKFTKYVNSIEPGINTNCMATTPGGESVSTFLRIGRDFFYPEI